MGCGQSKIVNLYPKNKKNKNTGSKRNGFSIRSASIEQKNENGGSKGNKTNNNGAEVNRNDGQSESPDKSQAKKKPNVPGGGPLLQQTEISTSQLDFFRMLDEKIENGPDYDENADASLRAEHASSLLRHWELASVSWSSVGNTCATGTVNLKHPYQQQQQQQQQQQLLQQQHPRHPNSRQPVSAQSQRGQLGLSSKDREGMRNIIGGRPESAPVYVQRMNSAKRVDGLQDMNYHQLHHHQQQQQQHYPSPGMPRHVLESISQSPTQSLKTPPGMSSPTALTRYPHYKHPDFQLQQQQPIKSTRVQLIQPDQLNGDYQIAQQQSPYLDRDYRDRHQQYEGSPGANALARNSPSNPYVQQFHITAGSSSQSLSQQYTGSRRRGTGGGGGFNVTQIT